MRTQFFLAAAVAICLGSTTVLAELGPNDSPDLAPTDLNRIKVGQPAPDFSLENSDGNVITLADFRGKKTVVLVFYRGYW